MPLIMVPCWGVSRGISFKNSAFTALDSVRDTPTLASVAWHPKFQAGISIFPRGNLLQSSGTFRGLGLVLAMAQQHFLPPNSMKVTKLNQTVGLIIIVHIFIYYPVWTYIYN